MTLVDQLDAQMRAQLRSRYRPLPHVMPDVMAGPIEKPKAAMINPSSSRLAAQAAALDARPPIVTSKRPSEDRRVAKVNPFAGIVRGDPVMLYETAYPQAGDAAPTIEISLRDLLNLVCECTAADIGHVLGPSHARDLARPRQIAAYLARKYTTHSYPAIGRALRRDHTSAMSGARRVLQLLTDGDQWMLHAVNRAETKLRLEYGSE